MYLASCIAFLNLRSHVNRWNKLRLTNRTSCLDLQATVYTDLRVPSESLTFILRSQQQHYPPSKPFCSLFLLRLRNSMYTTCR